jgi:hypothetical protein
MREDSELKDIFRESFAGVRLDAGRKDSLTRLLAQETAGAPRPEGIASRLRRFWDTTYTISLVPAVAAVSIAAVCFGAGLFYPGPRRPRPADARPRFVRIVHTAPDGQMQIVYRPIDKEGT